MCLWPEWDGGLIFQFSLVRVTSIFLLSLYNSLRRAVVGDGGTQPQGWEDAGTLSKN